jgi:hypothetical protein
MRQVSQPAKPFCEIAAGLALLLPAQVSKERRDWGRNMIH